MLRPGWMAFLPTRASQHLVGESIWAVAGFVTLRGQQASYDFPRLWQQGPQAFDHHVAAVARERGLIATPADGEIVVAPRNVLFRASGVEVLCLERPADALLTGWPRGVARFDAKKTAMLFAAITAIPAVLAAICGIVAAVGDDKSVWWGVPFWGSLVVLGWGGYLAAWLRHRKAAAGGSPGPIASPRRGA